MGYSRAPGCKWGKPFSEQAKTATFFGQRCFVSKRTHIPVQTQTTAEFTTFMRAYQDMVFSTAARLAGNDEQAEDIAQEVFIRAYQHFADLRGSVTAGGWVENGTPKPPPNYLNRYRKRWRLFSEMRPAAAADDEDFAEIEWEVPDTLLQDLGAEQRRAL